MSWFSKAVKKVGKGLKRLVTDPGKAIKNIGKSVGGALDVASDFLPPGLRQIGELGGSVLQGNNMGEHLGTLAGSFVPIPGIGSIPGLGSLGDKIGGFAGGVLSDIVPDSVEGAVRGGLKKLGGLNAGDILAGVEGARGVHDLVQQYRLRNRALDSAEGAYNERAGLRRLGVEGMMNEQRPDLSGLFRDQANPYQQPGMARGLRRVGGL